MSVGKMATQLADVKLWRKDLSRVDAAAMSPEEFQLWVVGQLRDNLAPLMEAEIGAISYEIQEVGEDVAGRDGGELVGVAHQYDACDAEPVTDAVDLSCESNFRVSKIFRCSAFHGSLKFHESSIDKRNS